MGWLFFLWIFLVTITLTATTKNLKQKWTAEPFNNMRYIETGMITKINKQINK